MSLTLSLACTPATVASSGRLAYHSPKAMTNSLLLPCDGCGQLAAPEHFSRRLQRLEWATRFRPLHIQTLLLGGIPPQRDDEFLYNPDAPFTAEARTILDAVQIAAEGKSREAVLAEFQKAGLMMTHVLECPLDAAASAINVQALLQKHLPTVVARIRRSLKPKRVFLLFASLQQVARQLHQTDLGCPVFPGPSGSFLSSSAPGDSEIREFREALASSHV